MTGSEGFIGRHFVRYCSNRDDDVHGLDVKNGTEYDVRAFVADSDERYDLIVHCAAVIGGREKIEGEPLEVATDLSIDADLFNWCARTGQPRLVYFSSSAVYPTHLQNGFVANLRLKEDHFTGSNADATYGLVKATAENLIPYVEEAGTRVHVFRPFSGYGGDQDVTYPFPSFIGRALRHEDPFVVWGSGDQVRDFIHVDDVVRAVFEAVRVEYPHTVNLCTGRATSFNELANLVTLAAGYRPTVAHQADRPVGVAYRVGDPTRMHEFYRPTVDLETGILTALNDL